MTDSANAAYTGQLAEAARFIRDNDNFLVIAHVDPDGDAIGSTFAMGCLLRNLDKSFVLVNEDPMPKKLHYLSDELALQKAAHETLSFEHVISLDCADISRLGPIAQHFTQQTSLLNIDHHQTNDHYGTVQLIRTDAAATAEIMYDLIDYMQISWNKDMATAVYTGMLTDTGGFRYANTTPALLGKASQLLQYGVNATDLTTRLLEQFSLAHIQLLKRALQTLSLTCENRVSWIIVTQQDMQETDASMDDLEGLVNYPRNIEGVDVGILFKQVDQSKVKISFRSTKHVDVSQIAAAFNGGGHKMAAGATVEGDINAVVQRVIAYVKDIVN